MPQDYNLKQTQATQNYAYLISYFVLALSSLGESSKLK